MLIFPVLAMSLFCLIETDKWGLKSQKYAGFNRVSRKQLYNFPTKTDLLGAKCCWCEMSEHRLREVEIVMVSLNETILPQGAHCVVFSARSAREGITVMLKENI